jgi:hypothetical protein
LIALAVFGWKNQRETAKTQEEVFMSTIFDQPNANVIVDFVLAILVIAGLDYLLFRFIKRTFPVIFHAGCRKRFFRWLYSRTPLSLLRGRDRLHHRRDFDSLREFERISHLGRQWFQGQIRPGDFPEAFAFASPEAIFDREAVYEKVYTAIVDMSRVKRGALITFEKKDNLLDEAKVGTIIKQRGVDVNAPVSAELLETIFYEGTRLHDGAVIIKDDKIARAAVFFTSTARPLTGKYGSRHQAAIGISENSDSVTVIVSEETGRIAIAFQGELHAGHAR